MTLPKKAAAVAQPARTARSTIAAQAPAKPEEKKWRTCGKIKFQKGQMIGAGTFGKVCMAMTRTGEIIAVKQVKLSSRTEEDRAKAALVLSECQLMESLRHPHIVGLLGSSKSKNYLNIMMEYVPGKSLDDMLKSMGAFNERVVKNYTRQILSGLDYCHKKNIVHRDIKGKNILIDTKGILKLADFGSAKIVDNVLQMDAPSVGYSYTPLWVAPEVMTGSYNSKVDVWSVGCVIIEMMTATEPWSEHRFENHFQALYHIGKQNALPRFPANMSPLGINFLSLCLTRDPVKRPEASALLKHPWLQDDEDEDSDDSDEEELEYLTPEGRKQALERRERALRKQLQKQQEKRERAEARAQGYQIEDSLAASTSQSEFSEGSRDRVWDSQDPEAPPPSDVSQYLSDCSAHQYSEGSTVASDYGLPSSSQAFPLSESGSGVSGSESGDAWEQEYLDNHHVVRKKARGAGGKIGYHGAWSDGDVGPPVFACSSDSGGGSVGSDMSHYLTSSQDSIMSTPSSYSASSSSASSTGSYSGAVSVSSTHQATPRPDFFDANGGHWMEHKGPVPITIDSQPNSASASAEPGGEAWRMVYDQNEGSLQNSRIGALFACSRCRAVPTGRRRILVSRPPYRNNGAGPSPSEPKPVTYFHKKAMSTTNQCP